MALPTRMWAINLCVCVYIYIYIYISMYVCISNLNLMKWRFLPDCETYVCMYVCNVCKYLKLLYVRQSSLCARICMHVMYVCSYLRRSSLRACICMYVYVCKCMCSLLQSVLYLKVMSIRVSYVCICMHVCMYVCMYKGKQYSVSYVCI